MPLTGELTDLSLAELIEFFCNQRKVGRLEVICPDGSGQFYLCSGSIVHAQIGTLSGLEAVHYALALPHASFKFNAGVEAPEETINEPWQSVVLEGLRLIDEGVTPPTAFSAPSESESNGRSPLVVSEPHDEALVRTAPSPILLDQSDSEIPAAGELRSKDNLEAKAKEGDPAVPVKRELIEIPAALSEMRKAEPIAVESDELNPNSHKLTSVDGISIGLSANRNDQSGRVPTFLVEAETPRSLYGPWKLAAVLSAMILVLAVIAVPWGWYARSKAAKLTSEESTTNATQPGNSTRSNYLSMSWYVGATDYQRAKDEHWSASAPMLIYFRTDDCADCTKFDEELLPSNEVSEFTKGVVKIRINPDTGPGAKALADQFGVKDYPSVFIVPANSDRPMKVDPLQKVGDKSVFVSSSEFVSACQASIATNN